MPARDTHGASLGGAILASVSRSFYLTIKILPGKLRAPVGLAYLLARLSDTIADTASAPVDLRLLHLDSLREAIAHGRMLDEIKSLQHEISPPDPAERELLARTNDCLQWLASIDEADRAEIVRVLQIIIAGQESDISYFGVPGDVRAFESAAQLEDYIYAVAGCVGEFWTRLCFRHLNGFAKLDVVKMCEFGVNFGKGLQLVNVLRDIPADWKAGRCYLPAGELKTAGVDPAQLAASGGKCRPVVDQWRTRAEEYLGDALRYIEAVNPWRIRYACILPWSLGVKTLRRIERTASIFDAPRIKVPRDEVRRLMFTALPSAFSNGALRRLRDSMR
jgi:farnesyl-diphosphate farnesyltransferase